MPSSAKSTDLSLLSSSEDLGHGPKKGLLRRFWSPRWLLACLCLSAIVQGMIFTNVVISSIERRFGLQSTQSGVIAGSYDFGSLLAVIPVTYLGGRPGASKPKYIASGMFVMGTGSLLFAAPHFITDRYVDTLPRDARSLAPSSSASSPSPAALVAGVNDPESFLLQPSLPSSSSGLCAAFSENGSGENAGKRNASKIGGCSASSAGNSNSNSNSNSNDAGPESLSDYQYVFILAQILHGIGAAALITLGTTLMDESVSTAEAPMFIGIFETSFVLGPALGYVLGGQLLNVFTEFYLLSESTLSALDSGSLDVHSPRWIGAWWLGFLLIVVLSYICAVVMALFPAVLPTAPAQKHHALEERAEAEKKGHGQAGETYMELLVQLPKALYELLSNATYMFISMGATMDGFLLAAMAAFLPKYFEFQFHLSPGYAAMLVGAIAVPAGAGGTLLGGYLTKRLQLKRAGAIKMYIVCQCVIIPLYLGFLFYCPTPSLNGLASDGGGQFSAWNGCNAGCACSAADFDPVCALAEDVTYFNPCFAGCEASVNGSLFHGCKCAAAAPLARLVGQASASAGRPELSVAAKGYCDSAKCNYLYFASFVFLQVFFIFVATMPGLVASLRSVEQAQRSLSLGLQTILLRGFGTVPGPIIFGFLMDKTCLVWRQNDCGQDQGSCLLYDNQSMSMYIMGILMTWRLVGALFFSGALYYTASSHVKEEEDDDVVGDVREDEISGRARA